MTKIAVVILNYNGADFLKKFLPIVIKFSENAEVIVADNCSTDDSKQVLKQDFPKIRTIFIKKNLGFAGGYNYALKQVEAKYYVLLNSDVEVTKNWIPPVVDFLEKNPKYAACQPKILDYYKKTHFEYAGACGGFIDSLGYPYCRGRIFDKVEEDLGQYNKPIDIFWATGAAMFIRSEIYHQLGGLDDDFFAHMEEIDLCWRIQSNKLKIKIIPSSVVFHVGGGTLNATKPFKTYLNFRNSIYLLIKNLPFPQLIWKIPFRFIVLDWLSILKFLIDKRPKHAQIILKAHWDVLKNSRKMYRKRKKVSNLRNNETSIVFSHFIRQKKKFSALTKNN